MAVTVAKWGDYGEADRERLVAEPSKAAALPGTDS